MKIPGILTQEIKYTILDFNNIPELIHEGFSEEMIEILLQIEAIYPFTFQEKESLRKKIDNLQNFFWIKNRYGFCELVNLKLCDYFDASFAQLENNHEEMLFPVEHRRVIKSFNSLTTEAKKAVKLQGITFYDKKEIELFDLINIPIIDAEDTVSAIVSISAKSETKKGNILGAKYSLNTKNFEFLPLPAALLSKDGVINSTTREFRQLAPLSDEELVNSLKKKVFSSNFISKFENFWLSKDSKTTIESIKAFSTTNESFRITLGKVFEENNTVEAILLIIQNQIEPNMSSNSKNIDTMIEKLIKDNPEAVIICDKENLKFIEANDAASNLYGYRRDEFLQMDLTDLYFTEDIQLLLDSSRANIKEGTFHGPYKHKKKDGTVLMVELSSYAIRYQDRDAHYNMIRDVTKKIENEKIYQGYKYIFENTDDLVFITDSAGFIQSFNQSVTSQLGYTKNELINSSITSITPNEDRSKVSSLLKNIESSDKAVSSMHLKSLEGKLIPVEMTSSFTVNLNNEIETVTLLVKVKQSKAISASEESKEILHDAGLKHQQANLDSKFLSSLFHELLTPVNVILGFAQEITDSVAQPTAEQKEASVIIKQNRAKILQSMNSAIEFVSLMEKDSQLSISETKITELVEMVQKDVEEYKTSLNTEFAFGKISSSLKFETDKKKFKYFLSQLFLITAKISNENKIYFSAYPHSNESFVISFRDQKSHSSPKLTQTLKKLFYINPEGPEKAVDSQRIIVSLLQKLLEMLKGKFLILCEETNKCDYGIVFPLVFSSATVETSVNDRTQKELEIAERKIVPDLDEISQIQQKNSNAEKELQSLKTKEQKVNIQNEMRIEALRQKIRKMESFKKPAKTKEETVEHDIEEELVEDKIEFFDLDLHNDFEDQFEKDEIEIIETTAPKEKTPDIPKLQKTDEKVDISNLRCLYIEDQIDSQILFSVQMKGLKDLNFAVSFEESLPLLESGNYDFIVIDINLQGSYNGLDILRILRTMPKYENTPVFAVTAYMLPGDQQKFVLAGFNGFISKPIFRDQMIDVLAEVFNPAKQS